MFRYNGNTYSITFAATGEFTANTIEILQLLLDRNCNINHRNDEGNTPLFTGINIQAIELDTVRFLIDKGADVYTKDNEGRNLLMLLVLVAKDSTELF